MASQSERAARIKRGEHPDPVAAIPMDAATDCLFMSVESIGCDRHRALGLLVNAWVYSEWKREPYTFARCCASLMGDGAEELLLESGHLIRDDKGLRLTGPRKDPRWLLGRKARAKRQATYVIRRGGEGGPVKIGRAADVEKRLASLQTACVEALELIAVLRNDHEADLHERLAKHRVRGEWFDGSPEFLASLNEITRSLH
jgi:hypothetical protein